MSRPDIIKGYPAPSLAQVRVFQKNNHRESDGIIGKNTRTAIWRPRDHGGMYTHLIDYPLKHNGCIKTEGYLRQYLKQNPDWLIKLNMTAHGVVKCWYFLTSHWKTGFSYLSTQDGITLGARRLATSTLQRFLRDNREEFLKFFDCPHFYDRCLAERPDSMPRSGPRGAGWIPDANNGFPLDEANLRVSFLKLSDSRVCWDAQIEEGLDFMLKLRNQYPDFKDGRTIALLFRAANSARYKYTQGLPQKESRAYRTLKKRYSDTRTHKRRIKYIEQGIEKGVTFSRK